MWNDLSMADKAKYIKLAVQNKVTSLSDIIDTYNIYAEGGPYSAGNMVTAIKRSTAKEEDLGKPKHNYDFTQSEKWADAHGYYPDERGHRDDRVKKPAHPTHPSRGKWNSLNEFQLTDLGMKDPNYIMFGMADGGQDPQATLTYKDAVVLPEITVTPRDNYIHNSYDNRNIHLNTKRNFFYNIFDEGGYTTPWLNKLYYQLIGTNTYEAPTLKEAIFKAIHNGDKGNPIIWNGNVYKAELNREDSEEYRKEIIKYNDLINGIYDRSSAGPITELLLEGETLNRGKIKEGRLQSINKEFSKYPTSPNTSYEDAIKWAEENGYIDYMLSQGRAIQRGRVLEAANQDPVQSERDYILLKDTYSKKTAGTVFDLSALRYNPDLIDIIANNLPEGYDIYKALTLPIIETSLGQGYKRPNLSSSLGYVRSLINNHDYELNLGYFNDVAQHVRNVWKKGDGNISKLIKEVYDIDTFKKNHPDLYKRMNDDAKEKFSKRVWTRNNNEYTPVEDPYMKHALKQLKDGKYNTGNSDYKTRVDSMATILRTSKELNDYLKSKGYIK